MLFFLIYFIFLFCFSLSFLSCLFLQYFVWFFCHNSPSCAINLGFPNRREASELVVTAESPKYEMLIVNSAESTLESSCLSYSFKHTNSHIKLLPSKSFSKCFQSSPEATQKTSINILSNHNTNSRNKNKNHPGPRASNGCVGERKPHSPPSQAMASGQSQFSSHPFPAHYSTHSHAHNGNTGYHHAHSHHHHLSQTSIHAQYSNTLHHLSSVASSAGRTTALVSNGQTTPTGNGSSAVPGNGTTSAPAMNHLGSTMYATKRRRRNSKK